MRNLLIAGLAAMSLIAFGACGGDEEETSTKECTSNAECADGKICSADNKCVDDPGVTPGPVAECTTNTDCTDASKPVCDNGTCVADSSVTPGPVDECTTNDDCTDATKPVCDNGTCVADDTQSGNCPAGEYEIDGTCYAEGDECDPEVVTAICAGNKSVMCTAVDILPDYSGYVYGIVVDNCADNGMNCGVISEEGMSYGLCTLPCDAAGEEVYMCDPNPEFEGDLNTYVCYALADGGFGAVYDDYETCSAGCDETKNACNTVDGWTCDTEYYGDGYCDCGCGIVDVDCADNSYESCDYHTGCMEVGYVNPSDSTACVTVEGVGVTCDPDTYTQKCDENVAVYCTATDYEFDENTYDVTYIYTAVAVSCESATCGVINGNVDCHSAEDACEAGDASKQVCYEDWYADYSAEFACQATDDGDYYYYYTDVTGDTWDECETTCNATTGLCD